jgi:hypothetical protein
VTTVLGGGTIHPLSKKWATDTRPYLSQESPTHAENMFLPNRKRFKNNATAVKSNNSTICLHKQEFKWSSSGKEQIVRHISVPSVQRYIRFHIIKRKLKKKEVVLEAERCRCQREG